ncbi:hypothetical protein [Domibacillus aminovorans]|nr:hypothetical protein [Domibacillus aminovorans]
MAKKERFVKQLHVSNSVVMMISILSIAFLLWTQLKYINSFAATWDQVDFSLALDRYDLMAMQPHFPGYPYFILGGKLVHSWIENQTAALTVFNILFYFSALFPMYQLAREYLTRSSSLFMVSLLYSSSYMLVIVNQPMSEGAAIACLWWYFWSIEKALKENNRMAKILPLFLFSVLLGIRLSYLPFAVGLLYLFYKKWAMKKYTMKQIVFHLGVAMLFQFFWVGALIFSEGSLKGFLKLSLAFTSGHFNSWGNTAVASSIPFSERAKTLVMDNVIWTGVSSQSLFLFVLYVLLIGLYFYRFRWSILKQNSAEQLAVIMSISYFFWALFAQNIDKPRHILPIAMFLLFLLLLNVLNKFSHSIILILFMMLLIGQSFNSFLLLKEQATREPATYQLASYLKKLDEPAVVYAWEETRVLEYLNVPVSYNKVETYPIFLHDQSYYTNSKILLTDKVLKGFETQEQNLTNRVEKIKEFKSNALFDPVYDRIILYEWK